MSWRPITFWTLIALAALVAQAVPEAGSSDPDPPADLIVFGGSNNYAPFEWLENGEPRGFNIDLGGAIARWGGATAHHQLMEWEHAMKALRSGEIDVLPMFASTERGQEFLFTEPFYYLTHGIFSQRDGNVAAKPQDLVGQRVAVVDGGYAASQIQQEGIGAKLVMADNIEAALRMVAGGEVDFAVVARHPARRIASDRSLPVQQVSRPFWPRRYVFAVNEKNKQLHAWLQHSLGMVQASGRYHDIYGKWESELEWTQPTLADFFKRHAWLILALLTVIALVLVWSWALRRQVRERTSELRAELERRQIAEEEIRYRAFHDPLTDLPNRTQFIHDLEELRQEHAKENLTVVVIKLNGVEDVVVSFGYHVGEAMVQSFGRRLVQFDFVACSYLGNGIFAAVQRGEIPANTVLENITDALELHGMEIDPRLTLGISTAPATTGNAEELLRRARTALAAALENRRPWQAYGEEIEPDPLSITLLRDYWRFGTRDLVAWLQPQIDLETGNVVAAEALVRWQHPELGLLGPGRFIPLLEKSGLVYRITEWMVPVALEASVACRQRGLPSVISVNVSASDLLEHDVAGLVRDALEQSNAGPEDLVLEMTESGLITEPDRVRKVLGQLGELGVRIAIDDFGTGYSSLSYLRDFPVQVIKLDRVFIGTLCDNPRHRSIVKSTIALAHELDLKVVAEGPEDHETVDLLKSYQCDTAQGFVYAKPMPLDEYLEFVESSRKA